VDYLFGADWRALFLPTTPLAEILVRGTVVYLGLFFLLRFVLKREAGTVGIADLLLIVLLADAAQNAMSSDYTSIADGLLLVSTLIFWNYTLDYLAYRSPALRRIIRPPALKLVEDGQILHHNLAKEKVTEEEVMTAVREAGVASLDQVSEMYMESDGMMSVITRQPRGEDASCKSANNKQKGRGAAGSAFSALAASFLPWSCSWCWAWSPAWSSTAGCSPVLFHPATCRPVPRATFDGSPKRGM